MLHATLRTVAKVAVASLVVGTILTHFGITADQLMHEVGLSTDRVEDYARKGFAWAWPNVLLGALVIVPIWFLVYLFRPPGQSSSD
jgi:meiotically up-regulated gene 157 (Mug157) protein